MRLSKAHEPDGISDTGSVKALRPIKHLVSAACVALAACGGGSGGGGGGGSNNGWLSFTPTPVQATTFQGESVPIVVTARSTRDISGAFNVAIVAEAGVLDGDAAVSATGDPHVYLANVKFSGAGSVGTHAGSLTVRLCFDDPSVCNQPVAGSPWALPYVVNIQSGTNLSPLVALPGVGAWSTSQGNASRTGSIPASFDPAHFNRRWSWNALAAREVVVDSGAAYAASRDPSTLRWSLIALSEATGAEVWSSDLGDLDWVGTPAVSAGKIYLDTWTASGAHAGTFIQMFDAATGALLKSQALGTSSRINEAPVVFDGAAYTDRGELSESLMKFNVDTLGPSWAAPRQLAPMRWAVDASGVYAFNGSFFALDPADGSIRWSLTGGIATFLSMPALDGSGHAFVTDFETSSNLKAIDLATHTWKWSVSGLFTSPPALSAGVLYVVNGGQFQARSPDTGALLWAWACPDACSGDSVDLVDRNRVVVAGNLAFFSALTHTYALDLATHQSVWSDPAVGALALSSNGVLYITDANRIHAINLQ